MEESSCLPSPLSNAFKICAETFESPFGLARRRHLLHALTCCRNQGRLTAPFSLLFSLVFMILAGCGANYTVTAAGVGAFQASSDAVEFGTVTVGQAANSSLTLTNQSASAIQVSDVKVTGNDFSVTNATALPITVSANSTYSLALQFKPKANGDSTGQLTVSSTSTTSPSLKIKLHGKGAASSSSSPALSSISCSQSAFTAAGSDACTVTLTAVAGTGGLAVSLSSSDSAVTVPGSVTVPSGASTAGFTATVSAVTTAQNATLSASAGGTTQTYTIALGAAVPGLTLSANSLNFGSLTINSTSSPQTVTLTSSGSSPLTINSAVMTGAGFTVSGMSFPATLNPGQTAALTVTFAPTVTGTASGIITLSDNASPGTATISLNGTGLATPGVLSGLSCATGSFTGSGTDACSVTLNSAAGTGGLPISLLSSDSAVTVPGSVTVPAGATTAAFTATVASVTTTQTATLTATASGTSATLALQLNAMNPTLTLSASSIAFGNVTVNTKSTQSLILSSTGSSAVTVNSATITGAGFSLSGVAFPVTLNPGQSATLSVQFDPTVSGAASGQLTISSTSSSNPTANVSLSGMGMTTPSSLSCANSSMSGAGSDACTVSLIAAAPNGGAVVALSSNNTSVTVPPSVTVPAGATSVGFSASVLAVSSTQTASLTASEGGVSATFALQLTASQPALSALTCSNSSITGSGSDTCTATLTAAAPAGGSTVTLSSNNTAVVIPASVIVAAGATSIGFSASITAVSTTQTATLTASAGGALKTFGLQLNAAVPTLTLNTGSISFGDVTLNTTATQSITLTSAGTSAVTVNSATVTGTGFSLSGITFPVTLNPGQTAALNVAFLPSATGIASGQVTISSTSSTNPTATVTLSATGVAASYQVNLAWIAPVTSPDPVAGYNVYRATSGTGSYQLLNSTPNASTTYSDTKVQNGLSYDYVVKSVDSSGVESTASNTTTVTIP